MLLSLLLGPCLPIMLHWLHQQGVPGTEPRAVLVEWRKDKPLGCPNPVFFWGKGTWLSSTPRKSFWLGEATKGELKGWGYLQEASLTHSLSRDDFSTSHLLRHCGWACSCPPWVPVPESPSQLTPQTANSQSCPVESKIGPCILLILPAHRLTQSKQVPTTLSSNCPVRSCSPFLQEKRMSKATEVMMQYVENLKRTYEKDHAELMEFKKLANQNSSRSCGPSGKELGSCPHLGPAVWVPDGSRPGSHPSVQPEEF